MTTAAELLVKVSADTAGAERDLRSFGSRLAGGGMLGTAAGTFGGLLGAQVVGGVIRGVQDLGRTVAGTFASGVSAGADFSARMDAITAVLGGTSEEAVALGEHVMSLGMNPNLKVSIAEAADAVEVLATQGATADQIMGGLTEQTILLANSTGGTLTDAANVTMDAMNLFGMSTEEAASIVNGATGVINQSKFDINDYAYALANGGATAAQFGVSFEDLNTVIAGTANSFVRGQTAGTAFSTMLTRLVPASGPAADAMAELGWITEDGSNIFFDSAGNIKEMSEVVGILADSLGNLTDEQKINYASQIFGTQGMDTALALSKMTREEYDRLKASIADTSAIDSAKVRTDNLKSAWETLGDTVQAAKVNFGAQLEEPLKQLVRTVTPVIEVLSPTIQWAGEAIGTAIQNFIDSNIKPIVALVPVTIKAYNEAGGGEAGVRAAFDTFLEGLPNTFVGDTIYQITFAVAASWEVFNKSGSILDAVQAFIGQSLGGKVVLNLDDSISFSLPVNGPGSIDFAIKKTVDAQGTRTIELGEIGFNFRSGKPTIGGIDAKGWWAAVGWDLFLPWDQGEQGVIDAGPLRLDFRAGGGETITINGQPLRGMLSPAGLKKMFGATEIEPELGVAMKFKMSPMAMGFDAFVDSIEKGTYNISPTVHVTPKFVEVVGMEAAGEIQTLLDFMHGDGAAPPVIEPLVTVRPTFQLETGGDALTSAINAAAGTYPSAGMGMMVPVQAEVTQLSPGNVSLPDPYPANAAIEQVIDWGDFWNPTPYGSDARIGDVDWGSYTHEYTVTARVTYVDDGGLPAGGGGGARAEATGTLGSMGGYTWVGERGPELVRLPAGARVWNNRDSMAMAGAGGPQVVINVASVQSPIDVEMLANTIRRKLRRGY